MNAIKLFRAFSGLLWIALIGDVCLAAAPVAVPVPPGYPQAKGIKITADGVSVPVLNVLLNRHRHESYDVASFSFEGRTRIELHLDTPAESLKILPTGYGIKGTVSDKSVQFDLDRPRQIYISIPGRPPVLIFANGPEAFPDPKPDDKTLDVVARFKADPSGKSESTVAIQKAIDAVSEQGGGTVLIPKGIFRSKRLHLKSNVRLHLSAGSALKYLDLMDEEPDYDKRQGKGVYFLHVNNAKNVSVTGLGLLDCNGETLRGPDGKRRLCAGFHSAQVTDLLLDGITIIDSSSWTVVPAFCRRVNIHNAKIVNSLNLYENDGFDPVSCQEVLVDHCFVLATDDAFCPKPGGVGTHGGGCKPGPAMELRDVVFNDCLTWTVAAAIKLGRQSGTNALNVVAKNINVINASRCCVIDHDGGNAAFRNVLYQDINVEGSIRHGLFWIEANDPGPTSEVTYERVNIYGGGKSAGRLNGKDDSNPVSQVRFVDCAVDGKPLNGGHESPLKIGANKFVKDVKFIYREPAKRDRGLTLTTVWGTHLMFSKVGEAVSTAPAVLVTDKENKPVANVEVAFTVESGGGVVSGGKAVSDAKGIAKCDAWTLGKTPGVNTLIASSKDAFGSHVVFRTEGK